jgi:hypothetical protein
MDCSAYRLLLILLLDMSDCEGVWRILFIDSVFTSRFLVRDFNTVSLRPYRVVHIPQLPQLNSVFTSSRL